MSNAQPIYTAASPEAQTYPCWKCKGTGSYATGFGLRPCFSCGGRGRLPTKNPEKRAAELNVRAARDASAVQNAAAWVDQYGAEHAYLLLEASHGNGFAASLLASLGKYGSLTPNQLAAVRKGMAKQEAAAQRALGQADLPNEVDVSALATAMNAAKASGLKYVGLDLNGFTFSLAPDHGKNPGAIYVKAGKSRNATYLGKVLGGRFTPSRDCDEDTQADVIWAASHPHEAAVAYGKKTGRCSCCGRELTDPESISAGIGPVCAKRFGWRG